MTHSTWQRPDPASTVPGPSLPDLMHDLAATPPDVWDPDIDTLALWADTVSDVAHGEFDVEAVLELATGPRSAGLGVIAALLHGPALRPWTGWWEAARLTSVAQRMVGTLAAHVPPSAWVADARSREEAARLFLDLLGLRPAGESATVAADRLTAMSSPALAAALAELAQEQRRAAELAARLAEKRAREAAARTTYV
ncbi:hypothetical protein EXU48_21485 [Occultella glacieicola]|uniref:Uncharacterized protein n=1 Tax=Occultella glacieicola TaxID=2518684 RepID=A0ABY2DYQ7_9MICO|nr:hypothetical protein [Occultella glacieicola]TDE88890.1 hypothetical protein EXU48_21485 [Occultella glacieicola]